MNRELLALSESDYQRRLQSRLETTGALGDVFPLMVSRNVPQYLLRKLWPEIWARFESAPRVTMFGAAEQGWRGRLENIKARSAPEGEAGFRVSFRKTYVMECESLLVLTRPADDSEDVALVWLPRLAQNAGMETESEDEGAGEARGGADLAGDAPASSAQDATPDSLTWTRRTETGLTMERSDGPPVHHYIVEGELFVPADRVLRVDRRKYATVATQLPRREITSMALLSAATLRREIGGVSPETAEAEARLLQARDGTRLSGGHMKIARDLLGEFFALAQTRGFALHPLWDRIRAMADQAR